MATIQLHLLHTNDVHSELNAFARLMTPMRALRADLLSRAERVLTFDVGDHVDASNPLTYATSGRINSDALAAVGYDGWVPGNNETLTLKSSEWAAFVAGAHAPLLCANLGNASEACPIAGQLYSLGGITVGVFGVTVYYPILHDRLRSELTDPVQAAGQQAHALREQGADVVVMLSHLGLAADEALAQAGLPVDVILGGHTHHFLESAKQSANVWICQAGKFALAFGHTTIEIEVNGRPQVTEVTSRLIYASPQDPPDPAVEQVLNYYSAVAMAGLAEPIAMLSEPLVHSLLGESQLVNLLCDQLREQTQSDLAFCIGGVIAGSYRSGTVRLRDVLVNCPTPMRAVVCELSGADMIRLVRATSSIDWAEKQGFGAGFRGFLLGRLHLSGGRIVLAHERLQDGSLCETLAELWAAEERVAEDRLYRVALCEYLVLAPIGQTLKGIRYEYEPEPLQSMLTQALKEPGKLHQARQTRYSEKMGG